MSEPSPSTRPEFDLHVPEVAELRVALRSEDCGDEAGDLERLMGGDDRRNL